MKALNHFTLEVFVEKHTFIQYPLFYWMSWSSWFSYLLVLINLIQYMITKHKHSIVIYSNISRHFCDLDFLLWCFPLICYSPWYIWSKQMKHLQLSYFAVCVWIMAWTYPISIPLWLAWCNLTADCACLWLLLYWAAAWHVICEENQQRKEP